MGLVLSASQQPHQPTQPLPPLPQPTAKMVPFAGYSMPIQYKDSIMESTIWCREHASVFDVSHMCGLTLKVRRGLVACASHSCRVRVCRARSAARGGFLCVARACDGLSTACALLCYHQRAAHHSSRPTNGTPRKQGKDAISFLEGLVVGDIAGLADGTGSLSVFTNEKGGIIDDTVITKVG